ncbi:MAG: methionine--tRNA ligase [Candidatus Pacebacteria bacterium]|nr:methionine--tRNA ligase [Candidatus Paceibacterota bacterium]MBP9832261.1 methionine--tRNA ligase [Candidatus Paceibacterota bacterium]
MNSDPHIGFALELVQADALVRFRRSVGEEVFFNTGTDEHGQKIYEAAQKAGKSTEEYVNYYANEFQRLKGTLGLSDDLHFIRTTSPQHKLAAEEMWKRCMAKGDIYKKLFEGLYCVGCEKFLTKKEIIDDLCHIHKTAPQLLKEENYFFKFSKYQEKLLEYLNRSNVIIPEWRRIEAINFATEGLEDFSISREKSKLTWGVPVPNDDTQVMYVWFEALINYISTLGWPDDGEGNFKKFWEEGHTLQMAGKDQVRFQSLMWQAMLMSADIKNTDQVFYHGFINSGGQKMSKSIGNVISPYELVQKYGTEATRYLLLRHVHSTEDTDVTWEKLDEWYTAGLVNGIGNLVARIMKLSEEHLSPVSPTKEEFVFEKVFGEKINAFDFNGGLEFIFSLVAASDEFMTTQEPYKKIKIEEGPWRQAAKEDIFELVHRLAVIAVHLAPIMPNTAKIILSAIVSNKKPENLFPRLT